MSEILDSKMNFSFDAGCKWDYILTIVGPEDVGKSTLFAKLGGIPSVRICREEKYKRLMIRRCYPVLNSKELPSQDIKTPNGVSQELSYRCRTCKFRFQMLDDELGVCKICTNAYIEAYKKGYRQAKRDNKQNKQI